MKLPRGLTAEEEAAWARLASSVEPMAGRKLPTKAAVYIAEPTSVPLQPAPSVAARRPRARAISAAPPMTVQGAGARMARSLSGTGGLDSTWDRKLKSGSVAPDFTLDLHDHYVEAAHGRLDDGMRQARAMGARLVLVITGRPRPVEAADRGSRRGVIRAKLLDWLAAGDHADSIAAIRKAHRRHGGDGALYVVLRRSA